MFYCLFFGRAKICISLCKFSGSHRLAISILLVYSISIFYFRLQHGGPCLTTLLPNRIYIQARKVGDKLYRILVYKVTFLWVFYKLSYKPTMHRLIYRSNPFVTIALFFREFFSTLYLKPQLVHLFVGGMEFLLYAIHHISSLDSRIVCCKSGI